MFQESIWTADSWIFLIFLQKGKAEGKEEGRKEGKTEAMKTAAAAMLEKDLSLQLIADVTGLPIDEIKKLKTQ
jgi:predicted transposase/invertase (TIGR01784 family)